MADISFIVSKTTDGLIHVQNIVGGHDGQHHVHSEKGFEKWKKESVPKDITISIVPGACACGLTVGQVKEINGKIWLNANFEEVPNEVATPAPALTSEEKNILVTAAVASTKPEQKGKVVEPKKPKEAKVPQKEGELMTYSATAKVDGKPVTHQFQHQKGSPWAIKRFAASKFFPSLVKDKKPLEVWKLIDLKPVVEAKPKKEPKAKKEAVKK
jgi:hypothetical protein